MSSKREALRNAALTTRPAKSKIVEFEDQKYEVRAPTVRARSAIVEKGSVELVKGKPRTDSGALTVAAVVHCTFVPSDDGQVSNERVFEDADFERLLDEPAGGIVDALAEAAIALLNTSFDKDAAKNV